VGLSGTYSSGSGFRTFAYAGMTLRQMYKLECDRYQQDIDPTARPVFWLSPPSSFGGGSGGWSNGEVLVNIVNTISALSTTYHLHDGTGVGGTLMKVERFTRDLDGKRLTTRVDAKGQIGEAVYIKSALSDATHRGTSYYRNYYDERSISGSTQYAWNGEVLDGGTLGSEGEIQALADRHLAVRQDPREVIETVVYNNTIDPNEILTGGKGVRVTWAINGLSAVDYRIAQPRIGFRYDRAQGYWGILWSLQLSNKYLELGDDDEDVSAAPIVHDVVPPNPVTGLTRDLNQYDAQRVLTAVREHFTASISPDVDHYHLWIQQLPQGGSTDRTITQMDFTGTVTPMVWLLPGVHTVLKVWAVDTSGNISTTATDTFHHLGRGAQRQAGERLLRRRAAGGHHAARLVDQDRHQRGHGGH
jgi:hypothetical protein